MSQTISTRDGTSLYLHDWAVEDPVVTVLILHGYAEHAGRYAHVADMFNTKRIGVVAADLRGHGRSEGARGFVERFTDYYADVDALLDVAKDRAKGKPVAMLGHSMGGLLACDWLLAGHGKDLAGLVLSSPFLGVAAEVGAVKTTLGRMMSSLLPKVSIPSGLKGCDVTRDEKLAEVYDTDPLNFKNANTRWYTEAVASIDRVLAGAKKIEVPTLLLYAGSDRVVSAEANDRFASSIGAADKVTERLADHHHEILNEPPADRQAVMERMANWLLEHAEAKAA